MPTVYWATAGTATVDLTILEKPDGNLKKSSIIQIPGCFIKNDKNLRHFVKKFIDDSADRNKFYPANTKYIFYSPVSDFKGDVTKAVFSYEKISKKRNIPQQKTKTCTVEKPLVITFDGHFFLCCDSEDLNKSKFLEKYSKEVRINQILDHSKGFYGIGMEYGYLQFISFSMRQGQSQSDIYANDRRVFNKLEETGPLILNDNKTIVGCYRKSNGNCRFKINMFEISQGHPAPDSPPPGPSEGDPAPDSPPPGPSEGDPVPHSPPSGLPGDNRQLAAIEHQDLKVRFLYDQLRLETIRCLDDYIKNGRDTLDDLKDRFRASLSQLTENERKEINTVQKLVETLEDRGVIGAYNVKLLMMLAEELELRELKEKVEKFEAACSSDDTRSSTAIRLKTVLKTVIAGTVLGTAGAILMYIYGTNPERLENLPTFVDLGFQLLGLHLSSVVFVLKVSSVSSLKRLWQSYKDGSLEKSLKKAFNEMKELKALSQGEEIGVEVTIDEEEYREVLWDLILLDMKRRIYFSQNIKRRHSVSCEQDVPKDRAMDLRDTKSQRRHSVCCERDVPKDKPMDLKESGSSLCETTEEQESVFHLALHLCQQKIFSSFSSKRQKQLIWNEIMDALELFSQSSNSKVAVNKRDMHLNSPLHLWASLALAKPSEYSVNLFGNYSFKQCLRHILRLLLKCGIRLNHPNEQEQTPLHMCRTWTAVKLLLDDGAKSDFTDSSGCKPLLAAAMKNNCLKSGHLYPDVTQNPLEFWREVLKKKLDPWTADEKGNSVLSILVKEGAQCLAKGLIEVACELKLVHRDTDAIIGVPLLITICRDKSTDKEWKVDLVKTLLKYRKSLAQKSLSDKDTALHFCCRNMLELPEESVKTSVHWEIAQHLILCGADINAAGKTGESCLDLSDNCPILKDLLSASVDHGMLPVVLKNWKPSSQRYYEELELVAKMVKFQNIGSLYFYPEALDEDRNSGSFVFVGIFQEEREVAVKRIDKSKMLHTNGSENVLVPLAQCEQIVQYLFCEEDIKFHYVVFELMEGNLEYYLDKATGTEDSTKLCRCLVMGLQFLQSQGIVHGNINPRTVFYQTTPNLCLKIGNCKTSSLRIGWVAPEVVKYYDTSFSKESDVFSCGLVLHYLLSVKKHPFAPDNSAPKTPEEVLMETERNIRSGNVMIDDSLTPEANDLVQLMLNSDPSNRPSANDVLVHPFFWAKKTKKDFLIVLGNEPEFAMRYQYPLTEFGYEIEMQFSGIVSSATWNDPSTYGQIWATYNGKPHGGRQNYNFCRVADLISFIRNIYQHINEYDSGIQDWWNKYGIFDYFPRLIIEVYKKVKVYKLHKSRPKVKKFFNEL